MKNNLLFKEAIDRIITMPITKSARKSVRKAKRRTLLNRKKKIALKLKISGLKKNKTKENLRSLYSLADKLAKKGVIHKNKARRLKSRIAKMSTGSPALKSPER